MFNINRIDIIKLLITTLIILKTIETQAVLIVGAGLPASGKSTTFKELAKIYKTDCIFLEPEEYLWPERLIKKDIIDPFNVITWLRAVRVSNLLEAELLSKSGQIVLVDSYYDKLLYSYIDNDDLSWLIRKNHKYFHILKKIAKLDQDNLPNADFIVFLKINYETWKKFMTSRNRNLDKNLDLLKYYSAEKSILKACEDLSKSTGMKLIIHNQDESVSPFENAKKIYEMIKFKKN